MSDLTKREEQVIALCLMHHQVALEAAEVLPPEAFTDWKMRNLFEGVQGAIKEGKEADMVSVPQAAPQVEGLDRINKFNLVASLASDDSVYRVLNKFDPVYQLLDDYRRSELVKVLNQTLGKTNQEEGTFRDLISDHSEALNKIDVQDERQLTIREQAQEAIEEVKRQSETGGIIGLRTSLSDLDRVTGGMQEGHLVVVAGRPGMGKTVLGLNIATEISKEKSVLFFSREMTATELVKRAVVSESELRMSDVFLGALNKDQRETFSKVAEQVGQKKLTIDDYSFTIDEVIFSIRRHHIKSATRLVVIDYLQLLRGEKGRTDTEQIRDITRSLKQLAKQLNITIVLLSQLNREVEQRPLKVPQMSDLRQSGSIEEDANIIIFCYRPEYYGIEAFGDNEMSAGLADLIVAKNRNGRTGAVRVRFEGNRARFQNKVSEAPEPYNELPESKGPISKGLEGDNEVPF